MQNPDNQNYQLLAKIISYQLGRKFDHAELEELATKIDSSKNLAQAAENHGIAPFFYQFIQANKIYILDDIKRQFQALTVRHKYAANARHQVLEQLIGVFKQSNIELVLLKGAALAQMIYLEPMYRPMRDIDVLVSKSDQAKARLLLEQEGFIFDDAHASVYMGNIHHLPNAIKDVSGFQISLEVHHQVFSRDIEGSQKFEQIIKNAQEIEISKSAKALTLDHVSMLNHLCRHTFSLAPEVRLIHQYDIVRYVQKYINELPCQRLQTDHQFILNTVRCLHYSIYLPEEIQQKVVLPKVSTLNRVGEAMLPYTQILLKRKSTSARLSALFSPSPWWMHVNYNIAPEKPLIWCYLFTHPKRVLKDVTMRLFHAIKNLLRNIK